MILGIDFFAFLAYSEYMMEVEMVIDISARAEELLEQLGVPWNGYEYERQEFAEINFELKANGVPTYTSFEEYLEGRLEYRRKVAA